ncbi:hypothetical protein DVH05_010111 [Phytophthora capsici]|nr:hypothetical protein DVH05_010111 [Phytophthora capsici]
MVAQRPQVPDSAVTAGDLSFRSVWKELQKEGWTRKPPPRRSLDDRYYYIRPGRKTTGVEGVDFVRGEAAVLEFYACVLRSHAQKGPAPPAQPNAAPGDAQLAAADIVVRENYAADIDAAEARAQASAVVPAAAATQATTTTQAVTTTQAATTTQANTTTPSPVIYSAPLQPVPTEAVATPTSQPAVPGRRNRRTRRSLIRSPSPVARTTPRCMSSQQAILTSPHIQESDGGSPLDDSASLDIDITPNEPVESVYSESEQDISELDTEIADKENELLADTNDSLNEVNSSEDGEQYGAIDSGDEVDNDDVEAGEYEPDDGFGDLYSPVADSDDHDETAVDIASEVLFAQRFLERFGGEDEVLAGNLKNISGASNSAVAHGVLLRWNYYDDPSGLL